MTEEDEPVQHCKLAERLDLVTALEAAGIEHLEVSEPRTIVIYQRAILMLIVTDGRATTAREFDVELWEPPMHDPDRDPEEFLTAFLDELLAIAGATRR